MLSFEQNTALIMLLYGSATIIGIVGMMTRQGWLRSLAAILVMGGCALQTIDMLRGSHTTLPGGLSSGAYLQILAWFVALCGLAGLWRWRSTTPLLFVTPLALILFLMSWRFLHIQIVLPASLGGSFYALHIGTLFLSLALMALSFAAGSIFIYIEKMIKSKTPLAGFLKDFPALNILDKINAVTTWIGFPLFTIGMLSGFVWAGTVWERTVSGDPKEILSIGIWILYAWLFHMRTVQGMRGRKPAIMAFWLFVLCIFSMFVVNTFMNTHHSFTKQP